MNPHHGLRPGEIPWLTVEGPGKEQNLFVLPATLRTPLYPGDWKVKVNVVRLSGAWQTSQTVMVTVQEGDKEVRLDVTFPDEKSSRQP